MHEHECPQCDDKYACNNLGCEDEEVYLCEECFVEPEPGETNQ